MNLWRQYFIYPPFAEMVEQVEPGYVYVLGMQVCGCDNGLVND